MKRGVLSIKVERESRESRRLRALQAAFSRRGFQLDPLTAGKLLVQRWGLYRVLDGLSEAQRYLDQIGGGA